MREYGKVSGKKYVIETTWRERKKRYGGEKWDIYFTSQQYV